jgi:hypothetical protein
MATMQGYFTSDGNTKYLEVPMEANWIKIRNLTVSDAAGAGSLAEAYWQESLGNGLGYVKTAANVLGTDQLADAYAITKINTSEDPLGTADTQAGITNADHPVVTVADATLYPTGSIVRLGSTTGMTTLGGMDFTVKNINATTFNLAYMVQPGSQSTAGTLYPLKWDNPWYPRSRFICGISKAEKAVISLTVTNEFAVGDTVKLSIPQGWGMVEADGLEVEVTAISTDITTPVNTITVDLDTRAFTAFAIPATGERLYGHPKVFPVSGAVTNDAFRGFKLPGGVAGPGGSDGDKIYWIAGDSFGI